MWGLTWESTIEDEDWEILKMLEPEELNAKVELLFKKSKDAIERSEELLQQFEIDDPNVRTWFIHIFIQDFLCISTGFWIEQVSPYIDKSRFWKELEYLKKELNSETYSLFVND